MPAGFSQRVVFPVVRGLSELSCLLSQDPIFAASENQSKMASPIAAHPPTRPALLTPSTFTRDISRAIMASTQAPKSVDLDPHPHAGLSYPPPPPPPSPVESRSPHAVWGVVGGERA
ncbi:hypothetical protein P170DRAFT_474025 [Aspergillus steynii IBT 23096]|uniref:Uncharacterized protein n=1 Tax=Aspergillus steynii IBT 23096 TaxID=1392250 RepID=A0A2I2GC69_9EURO|nr:uncharacterized protein P170DRAFT_474025 [Aspergillus steynii IBT 23096]PLB50476.1 hypothetical protein P170DRAFT_474025 [Aspergillus steynii IBT 23096]